MNLKINITKIKKETQSKISGDYKGVIYFTPEDNLEDCKVDIHFRLSNIGKGIYVTGNLYLNLKLLCSRCLTKFDYEDHIELEEVCDYSIKQEDIYDNYFIEEDVLDLKELLRQKITLFLPLKPLCKPECKGLCSICGIDLNEKSCNCETKELNPVWAKLAEKFKS